MTYLYEIMVEVYFNRLWLLCDSTQAKTLDLTLDRLVVPTHVNKLFFSLIVS